MTSRFTTESGRSVPAVSETEMREVDRVAIEETGPNLFQMMENAGRNLALTVLDLLSDGRDGPVVVAAGTGGNGGGGITAARHLANRGVDVYVAVTDVDRLGEVPAFQLHVYRSTDGHVIEPDDLTDITPALVIDAIIGYSLRAAPSGPGREMIDWVNAQPAAVLALDMPSGIDATTGDAPGEFVTADTTMTLALPKTGLVNEAAGSLVLADIGIPTDAYRRADIALDGSPFGREFRIALNRN